MILINHVSHNFAWPFELILMKIKYHYKKKINHITFDKLNWSHYDDIHFERVILCIFCTKISHQSSCFIAAYRDRNMCINDPIESD